MTTTIASFTDPARTYSVDVEAGTCSCPDATHRKRICKHIRTLQAEQFAGYVAKAKRVADADLPRLLAKYERLGNWTVCIAIRAEQHDRAVRAAEDAQLKALFS
jgi:predicted nucleic acid-binding Zn finger protein